MSPKFRFLIPAFLILLFAAACVAAPPPQPAAPAPTNIVVTQVVIATPSPATNRTHANSGCGNSGESSCCHTHHGRL